MPRNKVLNFNKCGLILSLFLASVFFGCAGSGHSSENFQTRNLNSCSNIADNQKDIDKIQARINGWNSKMNDQNAIQTNRKIEDSQEQILEITRANATQVQNCGPVVLETSR